MPDFLWVIFIVLALFASFIVGYFLGRADERKWNLFYYSYGHFYGRREERRKHRD